MNTENDKAKKIAAKLLSFKMYTCSEIQKKLEQKGISAEIAEQTVGEFCKAGILNDEDYAKAYVHDGIFIHMKGMFRIKQELLQKGVAQSIVQKAVIEAEDDATAQLMEYAELRFGDKEFADQKEVEKAKAHLVRRGYNIYDINKCFESLGIKAKRSDTD